MTDSDAIVELELALGAINVRLDQIERRADREEGAAVAAIEDLERKLGGGGVIPAQGGDSRSAAAVPIQEVDR
jgi:hypothetical protein